MPFRSLWGAGIMVGPIIGPTLGGWLTESFNWRWVFLINLPIGIIAGAMMLRFLPATPVSRKRFDLLGFFLIALADGAQEREANMQLFRRMKWIDIPIVYRSGRRALMTLERGIPGDRVLVVDDNAINLAVARGLLSRAGFEVTTMSNGQDAIDAVQREDFSAVLMDLQMPEMGGLEATQKIRELVPAGRAGTPGEVAALVAFLCSDAAAYINGQVIGVNGGMI